MKIRQKEVEDLGPPSTLPPRHRSAPPYTIHRTNRVVHSPPGILGGSRIPRTPPVQRWSTDVQPPSGPRSAFTDIRGTFEHSVSSPVSRVSFSGEPPQPSPSIAGIDPILPYQQPKTSSETGPSTPFTPYRDAAIDETGATPITRSCHRLLEELDLDYNPNSTTAQTHTVSVFQPAETTNVAEMAQRLQDAKISVVEMKLMVEDYEPAVGSPGTHSVERLEGILKQLDDAAATLRSARAVFDVYEGNDGTVQARNDDAKDTHGRIRTMITGLTAHLATRRNEIGVGAQIQPQNTAAAAAPRLNNAQTNAKTRRVENAVTTLIPRATDLESELYAITDSNLTSDSQLPDLMNRLKESTTRSCDVIKKLEIAIKDATDLDKDDEATQLQNAQTSLEAELEAAKSQVEDQQIIFGFKALCETSEHRSKSVTKPLFDGTTGLDMFTFQREFKAYIGSIPGLTEAERLKILIDQCLQGTPQTICCQETSIDSCWKKLLTRFGSVPDIYNKFLDELEDIGRQPWKEPSQQLDWLYKVQAVLLKMKKFAAEMDPSWGAEEELYRLNLHRKVRDMCVKAKADELLKRYICNANKVGIQNSGKCFGILLDFLEEEINLKAFEVSEYNATNGNRSKRTAAAPPDRQRRRPDKEKEKEKEVILAADKNRGYEKNTPARTDSRPLTKPLEQKGPGTKPATRECTLCSASHTHLYMCPKYIKSRVKERMKAATMSRSCMRCLRMDAGFDSADMDGWWSQHANDCRTDHFCNIGKCARSRHRAQRHILCCPLHIDENKKRLDNFRKAVGEPLPDGDLLFNMANHADGLFKADGDAQLPPDVHPDVKSPSIFMLQELEADSGAPLLLFYDSGCSSACISTRGAKHLDGVEVRPGPTYLNVAGGQTIRLDHGDVMVYLNLAEPHEGKYRRAAITGMMMKDVTTSFPVWDLEEPYQEIKNSYHGEAELPTVPRSVGGGKVDILLGSKYTWLFPKLVFTLPSGLSLYKSMFASKYGHRGVLGGPHEAWQHAGAAIQQLGAFAYLCSEVKMYQAFTDTRMLDGWMIEKGPVEDDRQDDCPFDDMKGDAYQAKVVERRYFDLENVGSEAPYRCVKCRGCPICKKGATLEHQSLKEEREDQIIQQSVRFLPEQQRVEADLPFVIDPEENLGQNRHIAMAILQSQMRKLRQQPEQKQEVLKSHNKLADNGYSCRIDELPDDIKKEVESSETYYYLPWRTVTKEGSLSTPTRCVFDASSGTRTGKSLNDTLAKGSNRLEKLLHLLINFRAGPHAFATDIKMAYNNVALTPKCYKWHRYLWYPDCNPDMEVEERVMKTLIYGVVSSGNQTTEAIQQVADYCAVKFPEHKAGTDVLKEHTYVDDSSESSDSIEERAVQVGGLNFALSLAQMQVKSYVLSGEKPDDSVSADGKSVGMLGYRWLPEEDALTLEPKPLYFGKTRRGKRPEPVEGDVRAALERNFTKRTLISKMQANYDPIGLATPITAQFKRDYSVITGLGTDWDDGLPASHLDTWVSHLDIMQQLPKVKFPRAAANSGKVDLLISTDASKDLAVACAHTRFTASDGSIQVRLVAAKSKIVTGLTIPRAELRAAVLGATLSRSIINNFKDKVENVYFFSDSTIVLFWLNSDTRPMSIGVRNNVVEVLRFSDKTQWRHIESGNNIADTGTRPGITISDIDENSSWQNGMPWMRLPKSDWPARSVEEIKLSGEEAAAAKAEIKTAMTALALEDTIAARYKFSKYILDPVKYGWRKSVRYLAILRRFVVWLAAKNTNKLISNYLPGVTVITDGLSTDEISAAENYYFRLGTAEAKQFCRPKDLEGAQEIDKILHYTGRLVDSDDIHDPGKIFADLSPVSFCKPILDRYSPISYAIMTCVHQERVHHRNVNQTLLYSRTMAYIVKGRDLAKEVREKCMTCRRRVAKKVQVEMGKIHESRTTVAPPFYNCQIDICGPFDAHCEHNHRAKVKVWCLVLKDPATAAVAAHVMTMYNTDAFLTAFMRFCYLHCVPNKVYIDAGSQLKRGCKEMEISVGDITRTLDSKYQVGVEHEVAPTGAHHYQGSVERSIGEIKRLFHITFDGLKLDILNYESAFAYVSSELNNMPLCLAGRAESLDSIDLITPARLMHGRASNRILMTPCTISKPTRMLKQLEAVYNGWWKVWYNQRLTDYIPRGRNHGTTVRQPMVGDVIIFTKVEGERFANNRAFKLGIITEVFPSKDGHIRSAEISYRNSSEAVTRTTRRAVKHLAVILPEDELMLTEILEKAAARADAMFIYKQPILPANIEYKDVVDTCGSQ
jgi:hypothetical protein